jgi:hypothetical protein
MLVFVATMKFFNNTATSDPRKRVEQLTEIVVQVMNSKGESQILRVLLNSGGGAMMLLRKFCDPTMNSRYKGNNILMCFVLGTKLGVWSECGC